MDPIYVSNYLSSTYRRDYFHGNNPTKDTRVTQATRLVMGPGTGMPGVPAFSRPLAKNLIPPMPNELQKGKMPVPAKIPKI